MTERKKQMESDLRFNEHHFKYWFERAGFGLPVMLVMDVIHMLQDKDIYDQAASGTLTQDRRDDLLSNVALLRQYWRDEFYRSGHFYDESDPGFNESVLAEVRRRMIADGLLAEGATITLPLADRSPSGWR